MNVEKTAALGAGVIGASWTSLFLSSGRSVAIYDPNPNIEQSVRDYIKNAWPVLTDLGLVTSTANPDAISFHTDAIKAVEGATFIQENVPELLPIKHALFKLIEPALASDAIVSSSSSGLTLSEMQTGWSNPARFVLGHPFNPPQ